MIFDSKEWRAERDANLRAWLCGNTDAVNFILQLGEVAEVWDDLIDGDHVPAERLHSAFVTALFDITGNPFFATHCHYLRPLMLAGMNAWLDSVDLEKQADSWSKTWAYALRDYYMELVPACAFLVGGFEHMRLVSLEARRFFQAETLEQFAPTLKGPTTRVWLENAEGQQLHDVAIEPAKDGMVTARFRSTSPFDLKGATVVMEIEGLGKSRTPLTRVTCRTLHPTDEFVTTWSLD